MAEALLAQIRARSDDQRLEREFMWRLGESGTVETILSLLRHAMLPEQLAQVIFDAAQALAAAMAQRAAQEEQQDVDPDDLDGDGILSADELNAKYAKAGAFTLAFGSADRYFAGLEGIVGLPHADLYQGMLADHTAHADADTLLIAPNYATRTSSRVEFWFVVEPTEAKLAELGLHEWPRDKFWEGDVPGERSRRPRAAVGFEREWGEVDQRLAEVGAGPLAQMELFAARLYTGPMFVKYNAVLRGTPSSIPFLRQQLEQICLGNLYTSTLHVINAAFCKLAKLMSASKLYRAPGGILPREFWTGDGNGVDNCVGGVEFAFMSATMERAVAMEYALRSKAGVMYEIKQGIADRGADLSWLSQARNRLVTAL